MYLVSLFSVDTNINVINVSLLESYDHIIFNVNSFKTWTK